MDEKVAFASEGRGRYAARFSADIRGQEVSAVSTQPQSVDNPFSPDWQADHSHYAPSFQPQESTSFDFIVSDPAPKHVALKPRGLKIQRGGAEKREFGSKVWCRQKMEGHVFDGRDLVRTVPFVPTKRGKPAGLPGGL